MHKFQNCIRFPRGYESPTRVQTLLVETIRRRKERDRIDTILLSTRSALVRARGLFSGLDYSVGLF